MGMKMNSCCCCIDLKTGVLTIGILALIGQIGTLMTPFSGNDATCERFYLKKCSMLNTAEVYAITIYNVINILVTIMMIYGSQKNKAVYMLPTIILTIIGMAIYFVLIWFIAITTITHKEVGFGVGFLIVGHLILALIFYLFMVIYSRYQDLRTDQLPAYPKENYPLYP